MADNQDQVVTATVKIDSSRASGDITSGDSSSRSNELLKDILDELKSINNAQTKEGKLKFSGLLGSGGGSGGGDFIETALGVFTGEKLAKALGPSIATAIASGFAAIGGAAGAGAVGGIIGGTLLLDKVSEEAGKTGEELNKNLDSIKDSLGIQKTDNENIVTTLKETVKKISVNDKLVDQLAKPFEELVDSVKSSVQIFFNIGEQAKKTEALQIAWTDAIRANVNAAGGDIHADSGISTRLDPMGRFQSSGLGYLDLGRQQSITGDEAKRRLFNDQMSYGQVLTGESNFSRIIKEQEQQAVPQSKLFFDLNNIFNIEG